MVRDNLVLCGGLIWNGELVEVHCDPTVGELVFETEFDGAMLVGEVSVGDPITLPNTDALHSFLGQSGLMGAVYTRSGIYAILSETVAELRPLSKCLEPTGNTISIDLNIQAEFDEE